MLKKSIHLFIAFLAICSLLLVSNTSKKEENNAIKNELKLKKSQVKNADGSITITITYQVLPEEATDKSVTLSLSWSDSSVNDDVNDYLLLEHDASNFEVAITMIQRATNQAKLTITSNSNPGVSAVVLIDFEQDSSELTDLTNTTWQFNDTLNLTEEFYYHNLNIQSNGFSYDTLYCIYNGKNYVLVYGTRNAYTSKTNTWYDGYQTITITGGSDATNTTLISWLQENGTLQ